MTNFEFYKHKIEEYLLEHGNTNFAVVNNELVECNGTNCSECEVCGCNGNCNHRKWLNAKYEEPITVETLSRNFHIFCNISRNCSECTLESSSSICKFKWILENYNLTKKEGDANDKS